MVVLKREPGGMPEYMTLNDDLTVAGFVAWSGDPKLAFGFARDKDAEEFRKRFGRFLHGHVMIGSV